MKKQILQKLELKDLQNYKKTLSKRLEQLRSFNLQLHQDNEQLAHKILLTRAQLSKKPERKVNKSNFQFDDLYKMGVQKMGDGVKSLWVGSRDRIRKFGIFAKKFIAKPGEVGQGGEVGQAVDQNPVQQAQYNLEEKVNQNADFKSFDTSVTKYFKSPKSENKAPYVEQKVNTDQIKLPSKRRIFDRKQQQQLLAKKRLQKSLTQSSDQQERNLYEVILQQQNLQQVKPTISKKTNSSPQKQTNQTKQTQKKQQKKQRQIKQINVEPNKVIDLQNDESEPQQQQPKQNNKVQVQLQVKQTENNVQISNEKVQVNEKKVQGQGQGQETKGEGQQNQK